MSLVEVFKTDVDDFEKAAAIVLNLQSFLPESKINFDLDDCDKILRIESGRPIDITIVEHHLREIGHCASVLE